MQRSVIKSEWKMGKIAQSCLFKFMIQIYFMYKLVHTPEMLMSY